MYAFELVGLSFFMVISGVFAYDAWKDSDFFRFSGAFILFFFFVATMTKTVDHYENKGKCPEGYKSAHTIMADDGSTSLHFSKTICYIRY